MDELFKPLQPLLQADPELAGQFPVISEMTTKCKKPAGFGGAGAGVGAPPGGEGFDITGLGGDFEKGFAQCMTFEKVLAYFQKNQNSFNSGNREAVVKAGTKAFKELNKVQDVCILLSVSFRIKKSPRKKLEDGGD